jgi:hypothetical protein
MFKDNDFRNTARLAMPKSVIAWIVPPQVDLHLRGLSAMAAPQPGKRVTTACGCRIYS